MDIVGLMPTIELAFALESNHFLIDQNSQDTVSWWNHNNTCFLYQTNQETISQSLCENAPSYLTYGYQDDWTQPATLTLVGAFSDWVSGYQCSGNTYQGEIMVTLQNGNDQSYNNAQLSLVDSLFNDQWFYQV